MVALVAPLRLTVNVSFGSLAVSPTTGTATVWLVVAGREGQRDGPTAV